MNEEKRPKKYITWKSKKEFKSNKLYKTSAESVAGGAADETDRDQRNFKLAMKYV